MDRAEKLATRASKSAFICAGSRSPTTTHLDQSPTRRFGVEEGKLDGDSVNGSSRRGLIETGEEGGKLGCWTGGEGGVG